MQVLFLAMALLVGGASVAQAGAGGGGGGGLIGGLLGGLDCYDDIDLLIGLDTYYVSDMSYVIDAVVGLVIELKGVARSVVVTVVIATGDTNYESYPVVCSEETDPVAIRAQLSAYAYVSHNRSPYACLSNGQSYASKGHHKWKNGFKRRYVQYCHDQKAAGRKRRGATEEEETRQREIEMEKQGINYGCVAYCPGCDPNNYGSFSLYTILYGSIYKVWYTYSAGSLLACIVELVTDLLCALLSILG